MTQTLVAICAIALIDSINPATIAQAAVFAGTKRPVQAVMGFWCGAMLTYLATGLLVLAGLDRIVSGIVNHPPQWVLVSLMVIGIGAVATGLILWKRRDAKAVGGLLIAGSGRTAFTVGVLATVTDLPTAVPYFAAIGLITGAGLNQVSQLALMLTYNLIYMLPVLLVLLLRLVAGDRSRAPLEALTTFIAKWADRLLALLLVVGGVAATIYAALTLA